MKKSGSERRAPRRAFTLLEVALACILAGLVVSAVYLVDGEVRRSYAVMRRELILETVYRDMMADEDRSVFPALSRAVDQRPWPATPIRPIADQLALSGDPAPGRDLTVRLVRSPAGNQLSASEDHQTTWRGWIGVGDRGLLQGVHFHYGGWRDATDVPPAGSRPFQLDPRVRYDLLRLNHQFGGRDAVPYYAQAGWTPRAVDWRWAPASHAGAPVPLPEHGLFAPIAVAREAIPAAAGLPFDLFNRGQGSGGIGWLTWDGAPDTNTLVANLTEPRSNTYTNPDDPTGTDHVLTAGSWLPATPGHHTGAAAALDALRGREILVAVWDRTRGRGSNTEVQASGFVRLRLDTSDVPGARATFLSWTDDQGQDLPSAEWPAAPAASTSPVASPLPAATPTPVPPSASSSAPPSAPPSASPSVPAGVAVMSIALNVAGTVGKNVALGWLREGTDFAWVAWRGVPTAVSLAQSLSWPGDVATYLDPADSADTTPDPGDEVLGVTGGVVDTAVRNRVKDLEGATFVVPLYDQVNGNRFRISGFASISLVREDAANGKLRILYLGPCTLAGAPL